MAAANTSTAEVVVGLYAYSIDSNGYYKLIRVGSSTSTSDVSDSVNSNLYDVTGAITTGTTVSGTAHGLILAGDAKSLNGLVASTVVDDNTVFVIANYNDNGIITGYNVVKGFKNIPDLLGSGIDASVTNAVSISVEAVYNHVADEDDVNNTFDLVFIRNASQSTDTVGTAVADTAFMLVDATPEEQFSTYDRHAVIKNGTATTLDFVPGIVAAQPISANSFYTIATTAGGYVASATALTTSTYTLASYRAPGVLTGTDSGNNAGTLITLANNCVIYHIGTDNTVTTVTAKDLDGVSATVCVAATDVYGFATVVYAKY
jgi:hypothetical protein